eukprot:s124_g11.t1
MRDLCLSLYDGDTRRISLTPWELDLGCHSSAVLRSLLVVFLCCGAVIGAVLRLMRKPQKEESVANYCNGIRKCPNVRQLGHIPILRLATWAPLETGGLIQSHPLQGTKNPHLGVPVGGVPCHASHASENGSESARALRPIYEFVPEESTDHP